MRAAHILLMRLYERNRFAGAAWSGHQLFLSVSAVAAQGQPQVERPISTLVSSLTKFSAEEVIGMELRLFEIEGRFQGDSFDLLHLTDLTCGVIGKRCTAKDGLVTLPSSPRIEIRSAIVDAKFPIGMDCRPRFGRYGLILT